MIDTMFSRNGRNVLSSIGIDMLTDFVSGFLARRALSKREQKQNNVLLFWDKAQRAKKVVNISLPILEKDQCPDEIEDISENQTAF